jgi:hypothetical protein
MFTNYPDAKHFFIERLQDAPGQLYLAAEMPAHDQHPAINFLDPVQLNQSGPVLSNIR